MIKKLRRQFILIATAAVLIILTALIGVTAASVYGVVNLFVSRTLDEFRENSRNSSEDFITKQLLGPLDGYDVFYYELTIDDDFNVLSYDDSHNPQQLTSSAAQTLADKAEQSKKSSRFSYADRYYAWLLNNDNKQQSLVIIDYTMVMNWVGQIQHISLIVGIAGFIVFELLIIILSDKAIQPALRNAENQKRFITNASHELKTPVAVISADNEVIEALHGKDEWTESIASQVRRLNSLITSLVQLVKSGEREKADLKDTNVSLVIQKSVNEYKPLMTSQKLSLETDIEPDLHVKSDEKVISEIAGILLDNAAKYCDPGGMVKAEVHKTRTTVYLCISNDYKDGQNVDYDKFFERFYREDQSHNSAKKGFGIGLSIAQELTDSIKASIHADWKDNRIFFTIKF